MASFSDIWQLYTEIICSIEAHTKEKSLAKYEAKPRAKPTGNRELYGFSHLIHEHFLKCATSPSILHTPYQEFTVSNLMVGTVKMIQFIFI